MSDEPVTTQGRLRLGPADVVRLDLPVGGYGPPTEEVNGSDNGGAPG